MKENILVTQPSRRGISKFWEDCSNNLDNLVSEYRSSNGRPRRWRVVPASLITMVWKDSAKLGFVRSTRAIDTISKLFYNNIVSLQVNNEIAEHDTLSKEEVLADYDFNDSDEMEQFVDWAIDCETGWRISDYGIKHLIKYASLLADEPSSEDKLLICDAILNVVHPRSDLASWFVEGGSSTMSDISIMSLNEDNGLPTPIQSLVDFLSDGRQTHEMYQKGDILTYKGEVGEVNSSNDRMVHLQMRDGTTRIIRRNDPDLEVAHYSQWIIESAYNRTITNYGSWISYEGVVYPVGFEKHDEAIYEIENCSYGDAIHSGWIRVVNPVSFGKWHVEAGPSITASAISALRSLMDDRGAFIDTHNLDADADEMLVSFKTENSKQTIALLNAYRRGALYTDQNFQRFIT